MATLKWEENEYRIEPARVKYVMRGPKGAVYLLVPVDDEEDCFRPVSEAAIAAPTPFAGFVLQRRGRQFTVKLAGPKWKHRCRRGRLNN